MSKLMGVIEATIEVMTASACERQGHHHQWRSLMYTWPRFDDKCSEQYLMHATQCRRLIELVIAGGCLGAEVPSLVYRRLCCSGSYCSLHRVAKTDEANYSSPRGAVLEYEADDWRKTAANIFSRFFQVNVEALRNFPVAVSSRDNI